MKKGTGAYNGTYGQEWNALFIPYYPIYAPVPFVPPGLTVALSLAGFVTNPCDHRLSVTESFHVGIWGGFDGPTFGCLMFFNNAQYGPYRGSIIGLSAGPDDPPQYQLSAWGDWDYSGVYSRHIYWPDSDTTLWTLAISLLYPLFLFAMLPLAWMWRHWSARRLRA
jgi:hypothetical protein